MNSTVETDHDPDAATRVGLMPLWLENMLIAGALLGYAAYLVARRRVVRRAA